MHFHRGNMTPRSQSEALKGKSSAALKSSTQIYEGNSEMWDTDGAAVCE